MTTLQKIIVAALLTTATCVAIYEARRASRLLDEVRQLHQERDEAERQLAALRDDKERSAPSTVELLKLRRDVGVLRRQLAEANMAKTQPSAPLVQASQPADLLELQKQAARIKMLDGMNYTRHFLSFAEDNQGWLPTNWHQVARFTNNYPVTGTNEFELIHTGPVNVTELGSNAGKTILVREFLSWPTVDGQWGKIYAFADGHSEVIILPDGNFTAWEQQNTFNPESIPKP